MTANPNADELEKRHQQRLEQEVARLRAESRRAVEEFKKTFPPPSDEQIERLLYPELSEFSVELGGRRFLLRELPALIEKTFLRLVEQKLPALVSEILSFDERLGDDPGRALAQLLGRAGAAMDLLSETCVLVLDPSGEAGLTREFLQQHASTNRQVRILQAQLLINGGRDFLSRLFPAPREPQATEGPALKATRAPEASSNNILAPSPQSAGSSSSTRPPA